MKRLGRLVYLTVTASFLIALSTPTHLQARPADAWWNTNWSYRNELSFDMSGVGQDFTNWPLYVGIDSSSFDFSRFNANGSDIRFTDSDGTLLPHYLETWNYGSEFGLAIIQVPQMDQDTDYTDYIYIYYGNSGAGSIEDAEGVWNRTNCQIALTREGSDNTDVLDATSNSYDFHFVGTGGGWTTVNNLYVLDLYGADTENMPGLRMDAFDWRTNDNTATILAWINIEEVYGTFHSIFNLWDTTGDYGISFDYYGVGHKYLDFYYYDASTWDEVDYEQEVVVDVWFPVAITTNGSAYQLYQSGQPVTTHVAFGSNSGKFLDDLVPTIDLVYWGHTDSESTDALWGYMGLPLYFSEALTDAEVENLFNQTDSLFGGSNTFLDYGEIETYTAPTTVSIIAGLVPAVLGVLVIAVLLTTRSIVHVGVVGLLGILSIIVLQGIVSALS